MREQPTPDSETTPQPLCPDCKGLGSVEILVDGYRDGARFGERRRRLCTTCNGWGSVSIAFEQRRTTARAIRDQRVAKGWTQADAATFLHLDVPAYSRAEQGRPDSETDWQRFLALRKELERE